MTPPTSSEATTPIELEGLYVQEGMSPWQALGESWSSRSLRKRLLAPVTERSVAANPEAANRNGAGTSGLQQVNVPPKAPVAPPVVSFGKRSFKRLYEWEGVVQSVEDGWFTARLTPFENGEPDLRRIEYAEFDFNDLADESDIALVRQGGVFYWTIGRSSNEAGTIANQSLVRFRRIPPPTTYQKQKARKEARDLMEALGDDA